jgi:predicted peptidase
MTFNCQVSYPSGEAKRRRHFILPPHSIHPDKGSWGLALTRALLAMVVLALTTDCFGAAANAEDFIPCIYTNAAGRTLPYRLLLPLHYDPQQSYPVILYLHGAAARGDDNLEPLNWGPRLFLDKHVREKHGFFLVVPQCPRDSGWIELSWGGLATPRESPSLAMALELVEKALPKQFNTDSHRRYLTGVSMGGHAVWVEMVRHPGFFAAAVPVCSGGSAHIVTSAAAKYPVWAFHSDDDHLVPVQEARDLVAAWRAHGGTAKYTEYSGLKHSSWKKAYVDSQMFDWLFAQHLP